MVKVLEELLILPKPTPIEPETSAPVRVMLSWVALGIVEEIEGTPVPSVTRTPLFPVANPVTVLAPFEYKRFEAV